jgi:hypothetical protein
MISAVFIYSMGFDLVILTLSAAKLAFPLKGRSALVRLLFSDGSVRRRRACPHPLTPRAA